MDLALATFTAASILRYVLRVPAVTRNVIVAAICVYMQIGLIFARLFFFVDQATHMAAIINGDHRSSACRSSCTSASQR